MNGCQGTKYNKPFKHNTPLIKDQNIKDTGKSEIAKTLELGPKPVEGDTRKLGKRKKISSEAQRNYLIISDGVFSKSKSLISNNLTQPRFNKMLAIRGTIANSQKIDCKNISLFLGPDFHQVIYPVSQNGDLNFIAIMRYELTLEKQKNYSLFSESSFIKKVLENVPKENNIETKNSSSSIEPKLDSLGRAYATGRRKTSVSRVWIKYGQPKIVVNGKPVEKYFLRKIYTSILEAPLSKTDNLDKIEILTTVSGGGLSGQAGAIRHGIARALVKFEPDLRKNLKSKGLLTRDSRIVERKKYGKAKARRSYQFSKR